MNNLIICYHGLWEEYTPEDVWDVPSNVLFCRRVGDGIDFYENRTALVDVEGCNFTADLVDGHYLIRSASDGEVPCYPAGKHYFTVSGWDRPFEELVRYRVNASDYTLEKVPEEVLPVTRVSSRQFKLQLYRMGLFEQVEALVATQPMDVQLAYANSATFEIGDTMLQVGLYALNFSEEQVQAFFEEAALI